MLLHEEITKVRVDVASYIDDNLMVGNPAVIYEKVKLLLDNRLVLKVMKWLQYYLT